jgi:hypothetical protein
MKTPEEKYRNDPEYHSLVQLLESFIERAAFTPSELREASILACINYEMRHIREHRFLIPPDVDNAFKIIKSFTNKG